MNRVTLTEKFASRLRREIKSGKWSTDRALPSERELSRRFGISRITARRSLKALCEEGLIEAKPARGYFIVPGAAEAPPADEGRAILFIQHSTSDEPMLDATHAGIVNGAIQAAKQRGLEVYVTYQEPMDLRRSLRENWGNNLRGVLLDWNRHDLAELLLEEGIPFVLVENDMEDLDVTSVIQDNRGGMRVLLEHFAVLGHRRIGLIGTDRTSVHVRTRLSAYREYLLRRGWSGPPEWAVLESLDTDGGRRAMASFLESRDRPTAIVVLHRDMLTGVIEELLERGMQYPQDISLAVWGEPVPGEPGGRFTDVTHVSWSKQEMGRMAIRALEERIRVERTERIEMPIEAKLIECGSVRELTPESE